MIRRHFVSAPTAAALLTSLATSTPLCSACDFANGGFETPDTPPSSFITVSPGAEPAGFAWTVVSGDVDVVDSFAGLTAFAGGQFLDCTGIVPGAIRQTLPSDADTVYEVTLHYANNYLTNSIGGGLIEIRDADSDDLLLEADVIHDTSAPGFMDWRRFTATFVATGRTTQLTITDTMGSANGGLLLDAVAVRLPCPADLTSDCAVAVNDLLVVLGAWGTPAGDITSDGETNVADLLAVLDAWGPCPGG